MAKPTTTSTPTSTCAFMMAFWGEGPCLRGALHLHLPRTMLLGLELQGGFESGQELLWAELYSYLGQDLGWVRK